MKKILLLLTVVFTVFFVSAQNASNYAFSTNASGSLALDMNNNALDMSNGTSTMIGAGVFGGASETREMGFEFWYMGTRCNTFNATSNGVIGLLDNNKLVTNNGTALANSTGNRIVVFQNGVTAANMMANLANGKVHTKLFGSEGSFVRVVEWLNMSLNNTSATADATFQLRLYQSTGTIEFVYGAMNIGFGGPYTTNAGFSTSTTALQSINFSTHTSGFSLANNSLPNGTITSLNSAADGSRRVYRYTPALPNAATGLNFTAVTANGGTLNWTDNSSDEAGFAIYRSIDGGATYKFFTTAAANATSSALTGLLLPGTNYMWRVFTVREFLAAPISGTLTTLPGGKKTSAGSGNWNSTTPDAPWPGGNVPTTTDTVIIADGHTVTVDANSSCANLTVGQGGATSILQYHGGAAVTLTINGNLTIVSNGQVLAPSTGSIVAHALTVGGVNNVHSSGSIINNGILDLNIGTAGVICNLRGRIDGSLSGSGLTNDFYSITVDKSSSSLSLEAMFDVTIPITMSSPTTAGSRLTISSGTFRISSASTITPYYGAATICAAGARFWLNNPSANVSVVTPGVAASGGIPTFFGELRIDNGSFTYGSGSEVATFATDGTLRMNGGNFTMNGGVNFASTNTTSQFVQTGGTITIDPQSGNNLSTGSTSLLVAAAVTCVLAGGDIVIVDPHSATGGTAVSFTGGNAKAVFGGNLKIGDGTSTTTGGTLDNTSGFGLFFGFPVYNLIIDNRTNAFTSRMARLINPPNPSIVNNNVTVNANAYLFLGSGTAQQQLNVRGTSIANSGTISGNHPTGSAAPVGILAVQSYSGNPAVTISGAGIYSNLPTLFIENYTSNAVSITTTSTLVVNRTSLLTGQLNPANLSIGNASAIANENPTLQFGGAAPSGLYLAGSFTTAPTINETEGLRTLIYSSSSATHIMGSYSEIAEGAQRVTELRLINALGLTIPANRTITIANTINSSATLNMQLGNIDLSGGTLTLGFSATQSGTLTYTAGNIQNGTFTRWIPTTVPTSIANGNAGHFPVGSSTGFNRHFSMAFSASPITTGGTVSVTHNAVGGLTTIPSFVDGAVNVDTRTNSNWVVAQSGLDLGGKTITTRIQGTNTATVTAFANLRQIRATDAVGTSSANTGSNTDPQVNRVGLDLTNFANTYYIGGNAADLSAAWNSIVTGPWENGSTWDIGSAPLATSPVNILNAHTVTVNGAAATAGTVNILSGGTLAVTGNTLDVTGAATTGITNAGTFNISAGAVNIASDGFNNRTFTSTGATSRLNVTGGTINVFGNFSVLSGGAFTQSDGLISINANNGTVSTASAVHHCVINTAGTINASGGTIRLVNPPFASYTAGSTRSVYVDGQSNATSFTGTHTFEFGDGVSTVAGSATDGFAIECFSSNRLPIQNVTVNSANGGLNRFVRNRFSASGGTYIKGNLTINSGGEFRWVAGATGDNAIGGNLINNGTMTSLTEVGFGAPNDAPALYTPSASQTISGSGTFTNLVTAGTANFTSLVVNNNTGTVTFSTPASPTVSSYITIGNGTLAATGLTLNGGSAQTVALTAVTSSINVTDLTLSNSFGATLSGSGRLNVTGVYTKTAGILAAGGRLTLKSTASSTARVAQVALNDITGSVNVERYFEGGAATGTPGVRGFRFIAHPFTTNPFLNTLVTGGLSVTGNGGATNGFTNNPTPGATNNPSAFSYNPAAAGAGTGSPDFGWTAYTNANTGLWNKMQGIRVLFRGTNTQGLDGNNVYPVNPLTLTLTGAVNTGAQNFALPATADVTDPKWSLVGNPYPSPIDIRTVLFNKYGAGAGNIGATAYVFNPTKTGTTRGGYDMIDVSTAGSYILPTCGVVLVQNTVNTTHNIPFAETDKSTGTPNLNFRTNSANNALVLTLQESNGVELDNTYLRFNNNAANTFENRDGGKMLNEYTIYTLTPDNKLLAIDSRPWPTVESIIPMGVQSAVAKSFVLKASELELPIGIEAYLKDKFLNVTTQLFAGTAYSFNVTPSNPATLGNNRFELVMKTNSALPSTFLSVTAVQKNVGIEVSWNTANEVNMNSYEVEESTDGINFTKSTSVAAKNATSNTYTWFDGTFINGDNYYRIKSVEKNGASKYSNVVKVKIGGKASGFTVYPNPVKGGVVSLQMSNVEKGIYSVRIFNNVGQELASKTINHNGGSATQTIDLGKGIPAGTYNMQITNGATVITKTVIVE